MSLHVPENRWIMIEVNRIYNLRGDEASCKILVDGLWPRGIKKEDPRIDEWIREIAPDKDLRKWFSHDPDKWQKFKSAYKKELEDKRELLDKIREKAKQQDITLVYSAKETQYNHAVVLKEILETN